MGLLSVEQEKRLSQIRGSLEIHRAMGHDVSTWEAEFFFDYIEKLKGALCEKQSPSRCCCQALSSPKRPPVRWWKSWIGQATAWMGRSSKFSTSHAGQ